MENFEKNTDNFPGFEIPNYERGVENIPTQEQTKVKPDIQIEQNNQEISNPELMKVFKEVDESSKKINPIKAIFRSKKRGAFNIEEMRNNSKE